MNPFREKLFKLAQTAANPTPTTTAPSTTVSGSPPTFNPENYYPGIVIAFSARNLPIINQLTYVLNQALYYSSNGQIDLQWMRSVNFNFQADNVVSLDLRNIMLFTKQVYFKIFSNNGTPDKAPLNSQQILARTQQLKQSYYLTSLSTVNPTSQLSAKIGGNLKTIINDLLLQIR